MQKVIIYTDGSSKGNPGPGGFAAIIVTEEKVIEIGGKEPQTTNNRMEITAALEALKHVPENTEVEIHTDSEYLINSITKWVHGWIKNGWRTKNKKQVLNQDLWEKLFIETEKREVKWTKVLGHSGHTFNDRCDFIATSFADGVKIKLYNGARGSYMV